MNPMRINKFLATAGVASRRKSEELILAKKVRVNGKVVVDLATQIQAGDVVSVNGQEVKPVQKMYYVVLNKPEGYICTANDPFNRPRARDLIDLEARLFSVGRLDAPSEGLILFTNDGLLSHRISHPKYHLDKTYDVVLNKPLSPEDEHTIRSHSIILDDGPCPENELLLNHLNRSEWVIRLHEGRNRIVRRIFAAVGYDVLKLRRTTIGPVQLGHLPLGHFRHLSEGEIKALRKLVLG